MPELDFYRHEVDADGRTPAGIKGYCRLYADEERSAAAGSPEPLWEAFDVSPLIFFIVRAASEAHGPRMTHIDYSRLWITFDDDSYHPAHILEDEQGHARLCLQTMGRLPVWTEVGFREEDFDIDWQAEAIFDDSMLRK